MSLFVKSVGGQSTRPSYVVPFSSAAPTAAMDLLAIEAALLPSKKMVRLQRIVIENPGSQTTAGIVTVNLIRTSGPGTGGVVAPTSVGQADAPGNVPKFSGICRGNPSPVGTQLAIIAPYNIYVPGALGAATPIVIDMGGQGQVYKQPDAFPGYGLALRHPGAAGATQVFGYAVFCEDDMSDP